VQLPILFILPVVAHQLASARHFFQKDVVGTRTVRL
jgi:hypothetical protein